MTATEQCLPVVRASMRRWLAGLEWPVDPAEDIILAVHEAVTNAVEHAYPGDGVAGPVDVEGTVLTDTPSRRVRVSVSDHGHWQPDQHDRSDPTRARGRGITVMEALMAEMTIFASAETGTQVVLLSETVSS